MAEWEQATGAMVSYTTSFGVPTTLLAEIARSHKLYVVRDKSVADNCNTTLRNANVNMSNVFYIDAAVNSHWIRDYGPWTIFDGNDRMKMLDFEYNRPRYDDNAVNSILADYLNYDILPMNYMATGGNVMTDGYGKAMSTKLVLRENSLLSEAYIDQMFVNYLGVTEYSKYEDPLLDSTIDHMDTWAKLLDVDKVMISRVPSNHGNYAALESRAAEWAAKISSYGTPYRVYRVDCGTNLEPYINSFIFNKTIYVPIRNSTPNAQDNAALQAYRNAMPGYTVTGYYSNSWLSDDALHCRVNTIYDEDMLFVHHIPIQKAHANSFVTINASITSSYPVQAQNTYVSYRFWYSATNTYSAWTTVPLSHVLSKEYSAQIPTPGASDKLQYTIHVTDTSGRAVDRSLCGRDDPYIVTLEEVHYRTVTATGNWHDHSIWECSTNLATWVPAQVPPTSSNSASITIRGTHTVNLTQNVNADQLKIEEGGKLIINADKTLSIDDGSGVDFVINGHLTITGILDIDDNATATAGTASTIEFNSSTAQETGPRFPTTANNIIVNNPGGLVVTIPITINGTLSQCLGEIDGEPAPDGYYSPLLNHLEFPKTGHIVQGWSIDMSTPTLYPQRVNRQWNLTGSYTGTKSLTFYWTEQDDHEYNWLGLGKAPAVYYGNTKITPTSYNVSTNPRTITVNLSPQLTKGVYTIGTSDDQTLPVELSSFTVNMNPHNQVMLQWVSQSETNLVGYRIYRNTILDFSQAQMLNAFINSTNTSQMQVYTFTDMEIEQNGCYYYWLESLDLDGTSCLFGPVIITVNLEGFGAPAVPIIHGIHNCYPNPFNPTTTIKFGIKRYGNVKLSIYNQRGQLVKSLINGNLNAGNHSVLWNGKDDTGKNAASGIYFVKMLNDGKVFSNKIVLMK